MTVVYLGRFVKVFWVFSLLAFLGVLLYVHVSLPPFISFASELSTTFSFLNFDKDSLFYWSLGVFIISNLAWYLIVRVLGNLSKTKSSNRKKFFSMNRISWLVNWFNSFSGLINVIIILTLIFINILFSESQSGLTGIVAIIYGFLFLIGIWFIILVYLVARSEKSEEALDA